MGCISVAEENMIRILQTVDRNARICIYSNESAGFVVLSDVVPEIETEMRYYTLYNFVGDRICGYEEPVAFRGINTEWWHFTLQNEPYPDRYFNFPVRRL